MQYSVEVKNVTKVIGHNLIIDDVSFKLEKGKIYGLVGKNGSGKSTLLKIIMGLYKSSGEVIINGSNLYYKFGDAIREVGGIVDFVSFYDFLTAIENMRYFALVYEVSFERIENLLKLVNLDKDDKRHVSKYSLGMKQRLGIAIALLKDPSILILDEPINGLDPEGIREIRNILLSFKDKTVIVSSHILSEVEKVADEILFVKNKKIVMKSVKISADKSNIKFKLNNYENASRILNVPLLNENTTVYMTDKEVSSSINKLAKENIEIYRVEEDSLESELLKMMGVDDDD